MRLSPFPAHFAISMVWAFAFAAILLTALAPAAAAPAITLGPAVNHPNSTTTVSGSGFGANLAIDIYWDATDVLVAVTDSTGSFSKKSVAVPADALPGTHWITAIERVDGKAAQKAFTVRTDWASFGFDPRNKRYNPYENVISAKTVRQLDEVWEFPAKSTISSSPAVAGGTVYIGSDDKRVYALDAKSGAKKWSYLTGGAVVSSPAVVNGIVYVGSSFPDNTLYALDACSSISRRRFWQELSDRWTCGFHASRGERVRVLRLRRSQRLRIGRG